MIGVFTLYSQLGFVVTGKLDVREAAAGLPEAVMEGEFGADE